MTLSELKLTRLYLQSKRHALVNVAMSAIVKSLTSLVSSNAQTIGAALQSVYVVFQYLLHAILGTIKAVFAALWGAISGLARSFEGLIKLLLSMYLFFAPIPVLSIHAFRLLVQKRY